MIQLYPFQTTGRNFLASSNNAILADDMGLGKTVQAIEAAKAINAQNGVITCPLSVRRSWVKALRDQFPSCFIREITSPKVLIDPRAFNIVNYDIVWREPLISQFKRHNWDVWIADEAHFLKTKESKRTKALIMRDGLYNRCTHRWMLTGTPILNRPVELYPLLRALCPEILGDYKDFYKYAYKFCGAFQDSYGFNTSGASNLGLLSSILSKVMLRRMKREVLKDLPSVTYQKIYLDPTDKLMALVAKEKESSESTILSLRRALGGLKIKPSIDHIEELLKIKEKIVVFAWHTDVITGLKDHFGSAAVVYTGAETISQKDAAIKAFTSNEKVKIFIGQLRAAGVGIDGLQKVCDVCVFVEMSYVPGEILQAIDRLCRIGQESQVLAQFLVAEDSMDESLVDSLTVKAKNIKTLTGDSTEGKFVSSNCQVCLTPFEFSSLKAVAGMAVCKNCEKLLSCLT